ncbi:MAG: heavy-metal-associated domain-containing protein [Roseburia sp.]
MENFVIICLLIIAVGLAITPTIRHFKGQGGCCGGSSYKPKKKKLKNVVQKKIFKVEGMHCENCSNRVMEAVNSIPELSANVKLKQGIVIISYAEPVEDIMIKEAIERVGYKVID